MLREKRKEGRWGQEGEKKGGRGRGKVERTRASHLYKLTEVRGNAASKQTKHNQCLHTSTDQNRPIGTKKYARYKDRDEKSKIVLGFLFYFCFGVLLLVVAHELLGNSS